MLTPRAPPSAVVNPPLPCLRLSPQFRVKQTPPGARPVTTAESLAAEGLPAVPELEGAAGAAGAHAANGDADQWQRFRGATLLRRPGEALDKAGELMRASQQAAAGQEAQQGQGARTLASGTSCLLAAGTCLSSGVQWKHPAAGTPLVSESPPSAAWCEHAACSLLRWPAGGSSVRPNPQRSASRPASYKQSPIEKMYR